MWRKAFDTHFPDMPKCPEDLTEPDYARLVFGSECYKCGRRGIKQVDFFLRLRACRSCLEAWYEAS
jgi:hypothetical protein